METWETVTMSRKEAPRAGLVKAALAGRITNAQGAQVLGVSLRQFRRLKARYRAAGSAASSIACAGAPRRAP
jgi:transposase